MDLRKFACNVLDNLYTPSIEYKFQCTGWKILLGAVCEKRVLTNDELLSFHSNLRGPLLNNWNGILNLEVNLNDKLSYYLSVLENLVELRNREIFNICQNINTSFSSFIENYIDTGGELNLELLDKDEILNNVINRIKSGGGLDYLDVIKIPLGFDNYKNTNLSDLEEYINTMHRNKELYNMAEQSRDLDFCFECIEKLKNS